MTRIAGDLDNSEAGSSGKRFGRLLDRMDARIASVVRAIWHGLLEGFALCGMAHCGLPIDLLDKQLEDSDYEREIIPMATHAYGVCNSYLRSFFEDLDALLNYVRAMDR